MAQRKHWKARMKATTVAVLAVMTACPARGTAASGDDESESRIKRGFEIAPVQLKLAGKNRALVGMGSYIVNAVGDCNGCHAGPSGEYATGGNPFLGQPKVVNQV